MTESGGGIPRVDLREAPAACAAAVGAALRDVGAFRLVGHGIDPQAISAAYAASDRLHRLDEPAKRAIELGRAPGIRGWHRGESAGQGSYETFELGADRAPLADGAGPAGALEGPNVWPALEDFREPVERCLAAALALANELAALLEPALGLPDGYLVSRTARPYCLLRLLNYPEATHAAAPGIEPHTDVELITLLSADAAGLELCARDGSWLRAPADQPDELVVFAGDLLEIVTGGAVESPLHRVVGSGRRRSIAFFYGPDADAVLAPQLPVPASKDGLYPPTVAGEHLAEQYLLYFPHLRERYRAGEILTEIKLRDANPYERYKLERAALG